MEMMERRGGGFAMEKRESSVQQRFRIGREGLRVVTGSKSKSIYPSIKKATPHSLVSLLFWVIIDHDFRT